MTAFADPVQDADEIRQLTSSEPLLLTDTDSVWLVRSGRVHVFAVRLADGQPAGSRAHVLTAATGDLLMAAPRHADIGLLAVGGPGTTVARLASSLLASRAAHPAASTNALARVDRWIEGLSAGVITGVPPQDYVPLLAGSEVSLAAGGAGRTTTEVCWVQVQEGCLGFAGGLRIPAGAFPVARVAWLIAEEQSTLIVDRSAQRLGHDQDWESLSRFNGFALQIAAIRMADAEREEQERLARRAAHDADALARAYAGLAAALTSNSAFEATDSAPDDPLHGACRLIGRYAGINFVAPSAPHDQARRDPVEAIARASRVRHRRVALVGQWWRGDQGPVLGYLGPERRPVALLPTSVRGYDMVDPVSGSRQRMRPELAVQLQPYGGVFYRPLPDDRPITGGDLLRFGGRAIGSDLWRLLVAGVAGGLLALLTPVLTGKLFDDIIPSADRGNLITLALALLASGVAITVFGIGRELAQLRIESKVDAELEAAVWDRLLGLPVHFFRAYSAGDLAARAMGISDMRQILTRTAASALFSAIFSVFSLLLLFYYDLRLGLAAVVLLLCVSFVTVLSARGQMRYERPMRQAHGKLQGLTFQLLTGIAKLRVAGAETRAFSIWARDVGRLNALAGKNQWLNLHLQVFYSAVPLASSMAIFGIVAFTPRSALSTGAFLAFVTAFGQVTAAILGLTPSISELLQLWPIYENSRPILEMLPEADVGKADPGELSGRIQVNHVNFRYHADGPLVTNDLSFEVGPGQFVAFVGPSGSGKSTIFRLLLGFETPVSGSIDYDGQDVSHLDVREVRRQLGVVLQNGKLMPGSIYDNIIGSAPLSLDDAWEAARMAGLDADIRAMPMGMHTFLTDGAGTISGGQRQRLMIARAIVGKPRILLFDEATSALDNQTQAIVGQSLEQLKATRIVIAHRLSTVMKADLIYVLVAGRLVQSGTYDQLLTQPGPFADLAKRQLS